MKTTSSEIKNDTSECKSSTQEFVAFTKFDYIVLALTVVGMIWVMWTTGNEIFMIIVAGIGVILISTRTIIRGQIYRNKNRWR